MDLTKLSNEELLELEMLVNEFLESLSAKKEVINQNAK